MQAATSTRWIVLALVALFGFGCTGTRERSSLAPKTPGRSSSRPAEAPLAPPPAPAVSHIEPSPPSGPVEAIKPAEYLDESAGDESVDGQVSVAEYAEFSAMADGLTLEALEQLAFENNPSIRQASAVAAKADGIWTQVGLKPNPQLGYFGEEIGNENSGGLQGAFVSQTFVTGGKLRQNRQVIGHDIQVVRWQVEAQRFRVRTDIRTRFYTALAAQRRLELAREFRKVAGRGLKVAEDRLQARVGARPDVLQSEIQMNEVELLIQRAEFEFEAAWNELLAIAGVPDMAPVELVGELRTPDETRDFETVYQQIIDQSPVLMAAYSQVHRTRANLERQRAQPIPNVLARAGAGHDNSTGNEFANVQISLPLPVHNRNQGNVAAAYAEYCEATQNVSRIQLQIRRSLARVMREYQASAATVQRYEKVILPKATETMDLMQQAQEAGEFDFLRVLTARRMFFDANLQYVTALGGLARSGAEIEGLLLTGGLSNVVSYDARDDLRGQALNWR